MAALSILDLAFVPEGATPVHALHRTLELARHAERLGYVRFWLAEHHNMVGVASAATAIVIGYVAGGTRTIRVGAGGIMLPNHAPLVVAEQFGTLASLYPNRIDLGLGRAPGTDLATLRALRRSPSSAEHFYEDVLELQAYFAPLRPGQAIQAVPGAGLEVPLWILGSSLYGAQLAAALGLPYAFASHFAPGDLDAALAVYREHFRPSAQLRDPYVMVGANAAVADTEAEARRIFTTAQQGFTNLLRGGRGRLQPPIDDIERYWTPAEKAHVSRMLECSLVGSQASVREQLAALVARTAADEVIVSGAIYEQTARLRSYELLASL
jgi:luciferase family oxidoreductase group 1